MNALIVVKTKDTSFSMNNKSHANWARALFCSSLVMIAMWKSIDFIEMQNVSHL